MQDKVIGVKFLTDQGDPMGSKQTLSSKTYSYVSSQELVDGDIVIVRTYDDRTGPLRFAKVVNPDQGAFNSGYPLRRIIQKLDFTAVEAEEKRIQQIKDVEALLKRKAAEKTQAQLFVEVAVNMTPDERALTAQVLGVADPLATQNSQQEWVFHDLHSISTSVTVHAADYYAALDLAAHALGVNKSRLTGRSV